MLRQFVRCRGGRIIAEFREIARDTDEHRGQRERAIALAIREGAVLLVTRPNRFTRGRGFAEDAMRRGLRIVGIDRPSRSEQAFLQAIDVAFTDNEYRLDAIDSGRNLARREGRSLGGDPRRGASRSARAEVHARSIRVIITILRKRGIRSFSGLAAALERAEVRTPSGKGGASLKAVIQPPLEKPRQWRII